MSETVAAPRVLIMGVGNILLRDEGFGVAAVNHLEKNYYWPENVRLQEGATQGLLLMSELEECDLLVVLDVVLGGKEPGHGLSAGKRGSEPQPQLSGFHAPDGFAPDPAGLRAGRVPSAMPGLRPSAF